MNNRQRNLKMIAIAALMALMAVACGGGADEGAAGTEGSDQPGVSFDGEDADVDAPPIPTTPPLDVDTTPPTEVPDTADEPVLDTGDDADSLEVDVLHVNDDVVLVPTFDAPNGNETKLYDVNPFEGTELEYPLLAQTVFGNRLALLATEFDSTGNWAKVQVPIRPNGSTAWVQTAFFRQETHDYRIEISISQNKVNVYKGDTLLVDQISVMGRDSRPTPVVRSYIDEKIRGDTLSPAYGDWVLSIAAYSEALGSFGGGMPKLALHGTNQPELMGQYVSSGCVRVPNEIVSFIAETVPVGTIVDIVA